MDQLCTQADLGNFIIQSNGTSIYTKRVDLGTGANVADIKVVRSSDLDQRTSEQLTVRSCRHTM
jgi:VCBS repeat-containing protein